MPLPPRFRLRLDPDVRRPVPGVLIGGAPVRVLRLTDAGASLVDRWAAGQPVGEGRAAGALAARLVEAGMATPIPPAATAPQAAVSVVVPVRDDAEGLAATVQALRSTAPAVAVVVVDDGSTPPVSGLGAGPPDEEAVSVLRRDEAGGPAAARNHGLGAVSGDTEIVVFVDAGCIPEPGWLETLLPHFQDPGLAAVAPRVGSRAVAGTAPVLGRYEEAHSPLDLGPVSGPVAPGARIPYVPTAVLAARVKAVHEVAGFDQTLRFGEDVDLVWRLHAHGWRIRYEPEAGATHPARPDGRRWLRQRYDYGRSATPLAARHGRAVAPLTVSPWSVAAWSLLALGRPLPAVAVAAGSAEALARRAGGQREVSRELRRLAYSGNLRAGGPIVQAVRRAWLPPAVAACAAARAGRTLTAGRAARAIVGHRTMVWLAVSSMAMVAGPGLADWWTERRRDTNLGPFTWMALRLADDLAYQSGVWAGAVQGRSAAALLPKW